ncbi:MAG: alanine racemase [Anaerolineales bacterium]|nr:alanine racemase [Anaerolineales bacterium]
MLTWAEIDLAAIRNNVRQMQALAQTRVMAVVKANAYGHGAIRVARAAQEAGAEWLGVARTEEGLALRAAGLQLPILVLGYTPPEAAPEALAHALTLTVFDWESATAYASAARALNQTANVHLKIDTGMGRLGVLPQDAPNFFQAVWALEGLNVEGAFTHFASADAASPASAQKQLTVFQELIAALPTRPALVHACNSAGAFALPAARLDVVRLGIALYGLNPSAEVPCPPEFRPALTWKARVAQVKTLPPGHGVSYGHQYTTTETETLAVVTVGYADGFRRAPSAQAVLIGGQRAPIRGRVCMDQIIVSVSHIPNVRAGDEAVLIGQQGAEQITADELARRWGTINYEVTSGLMARVARQFFN